MPKRTDKVDCPVCAHGISRVVDSRGPIRLRQCDACHTCWETGETFRRLREKGAKRISASKAA